MPDEVRKFMHDYCDSFRPGNADAMADFFYYPATMLTNGMCLQINSPDELTSILASGLQSLEAVGFAKSESREMHVHILADDVATVSGRYNRLKSDGSLLEKIAATYTLFKVPDLGWRIVLLVIHDIDKIIRKN